MFVRLLSWYIIHTFSAALASWQNFAGWKIHFASKSCVLLYWQRYCTALQQWASAKLRGVVQGMELQNFHRRRHLYLAGRPLRWASAHILVLCYLCVFWYFVSLGILGLWLFYVVGTSATDCLGRPSPKWPIMCREGRQAIADSLILRLHDTTGCQNRLYNRLDNRLHRVNKHPTGCQTGSTTGLTTGCVFVYTM